MTQTALTAAVIWMGPGNPFPAAAGQEASLARTRFEKRMSGIASSARNAEREYRRVEKTLKKLFPETARRSPLFLSVEKDFWKYRQSVKKLNERLLDLTRDHKDYTRLFSRGLLTSVDVITERDDNWEAARDLALILEKNLEATRTELDTLEHAAETFSSFEDNMKEVARVRRDLASTVRSLDRDVSRRSREWEKTLREFGGVDTTMRHFPVYARADTIRRQLEETGGALEARMDSLTFLVDRVDYLLTGVAVSGDENRVWDLYRSVKERWALFSGEVEETLKRGETWGRELENSLKLLKEVQKMVTAMDDALVRLSKRRGDVGEILSTDSLRTASILNRVPGGTSMEQPPYTDLRKAYEEAAAVVRSVELLLVDGVALRQRIIDAAAHMIHPDNLELDELREAKKTFDETWELGMEQADRFGAVHENFNGVILEHFVNTREYWAIRYGIEKGKNDRGETVLEENSGYLYDPHAYPRKPYHGQLISDLQLRLRKEGVEKPGGGRTAFVFEGSSPMGVEKIMIMEGDSVLYTASRDQADVWKETRTNGTVELQWVIPVDGSVVKNLTRKEGLILRVHHLTLTHRVNLTLFRKELYRDYAIPAERVRQWEKLLKEESPVSRSLIIRPPFHVPGPVGHLFSGLFFHGDVVGGCFTGRDGGVADDSRGETGGVPIHKG